MKQHIVIYRENGKREEALLPVDVPMHRIVPILVRKLQLPSSDPDGRSLTYHLELYRNGRRLLDEQTLRQSRVTEKTRLKLVADPLIPLLESPPSEIQPVSIVEKARRNTPTSSPQVITTNQIAAELRRRMINRLPTVGTIGIVLVLIWVMARAYTSNQIRTLQSYNTPTPSIYQFTRPPLATPPVTDFPVATPTRLFSIHDNDLDPILFGTETSSSFKLYLEAGAIRDYYYAVFGPGAPTSCGDPFSNPASLYRSETYVNEKHPGHYSYRYRIEIPEGYAYDVVRIEIFDPDSMNTIVTSEPIQIQHTALYAENTSSTSLIASCQGSSDLQHQPCVLNTGEPATMNPYWFHRVDGIPFHKGDTCNPISDYDPQLNTVTVFDLYYLLLTESGELERVPLATYQGQTGVEAETHATDLRWVSPGGALADDQAVFVPVTKGPGTFEVSLATLPDLPSDPVTKKRYLYLEVTSLSGQTENGYGLWAGPPLQTNAYASDDACQGSVPSQVNQRNLFIVDCAQYRRANGVLIQPMGVIVLHSNSDKPVDIPLTFVGAENAGNQMYVSLFDADTGAEAPVVLYFDRLAVGWLRPRPASPANPIDQTLTDWAMAFAVNHTVTNDPDLGFDMQRNCVPGTCSDQWISPAYRLTLPDMTPECQLNHNPFNCQPFYGGWLVARYTTGIHDTYAWLVTDPISLPQE